MYVESRILLVCTYDSDAIACKHLPPALLDAMVTTGGTALD
jgi:hypothetical protein